MEAQTDLKTQPTTDPETPAETDPEKQQGELTRLLQRAEAGDRSALPALREYLDEHPEVSREYGDLGRQVEAATGLRICGSNLLLAECLQRRLKELKAELGAASSAAERLLVEQVTITWQQTHYFNALMAQTGVANAARLKVLQGLQDGAQRRHLAALKALATVRKLLTPAPSPLQVATRLGRPAAGARCGREGMAGRVPIRN
jgi:hypothetical protein